MSHNGMSQLDKLYVANFLSKNLKTLEQGQSKPAYKEHLRIGDVHNHNTDYLLAS